MVKPLAFKGDKTSKKRKRHHTSENAAANSSKSLVRKGDAEAEAVDDDGWVSAEAVSDISGPVVIVLPTTPVTCLASDANGKVFTSRVENLIEGNPSTAEPHDVRQVWVAGRVAGTEGFSFKGHHGKYLSCDKYGILSALHEAISPEESFLCIPSHDSPGMFCIQTQREKFFTVNDADSKGPELRGDSEVISFNTTFRIRMQARFKPKLKANRESKAHGKITRKELEDAVGRRLDDDEVKRLKRARKEGNYHEAILDVRVKGKHDKFAS